MFVQPMFIAFSYL